MTADKIKQRIASMASHFTFEYNGKNGGVDPISPTQFDVWFDSDFTSMDSIESVMTTPFFNGKTLTEIALDIKVLEI